MTLGQVLADLERFKDQELEVTLVLVKVGDDVGFTLQGPKDEFLLTQAWALNEELKKAVSEASCGS